MDWIEKIIDEYMSCKCQAKPKGSVETADQIRKHIEKELDGMIEEITVDDKAYPTDLSIWKDGVNYSVRKFKARLIGG